MEIAGRADEIKEYSIATEALGHPAAYSPGDGSSVRNRAHSLRHKLQEYYDNENPEAESRSCCKKGLTLPASFWVPKLLESRSLPPSKLR